VAIDDRESRTFRRGPTLDPEARRLPTITADKLPDMSHRPGISSERRGGAKVVRQGFDFLPFSIAVSCGIWVRGIIIPVSVMTSNRIHPDQRWFFLYLTLNIFFLSVFRLGMLRKSNRRI
jgi:hypothetical protein